jgi:predicted RNase H-like HicB family nuclease
MPLILAFSIKKVLARIISSAHIKSMNYRVTVVESEEGFAIWCDDLPGCCSEGATKEDALENIRAAIREYLEAQGEIESRFGTKVVHETVTI